ncbi:NADP-dependent 3-hydroxy acid dehydrogenase YdfG [Asanoa ferruginea]|uniref:NADP-dependent 3-hydroxy acid dehydrogenase YdfG n=1 Tax=Asanoa ferruginea TaxID=53367 RepID=A0A3D9ZL69_9ACTN|nr:SDR family oxidoreductase [Asanoa ferruginea]REF97334.1 NADP-dependent 3-hydroxy acid dehydrogenase YdfG [Asanoa ferruginea]GIF51199.1 3-oxoacyl-ACP reductase [Asanoa ferruginea]
MLLQGRNAVLYGGAGAIGAAVARAFGREGATVHLVGRSEPALRAVADEITSAGGRAETAAFDAFDEAAVDAHARDVAERFGSLDVSFNLIAHPYAFGKPMVEMDYADLEADVTSRLRALWLTTKAAAPQMIRQGSGVVLTFGGYGDPQANLGGLQVAFGAVEALRRTLARELGQHGIRVLTLQTGGVPESLTNEDPKTQRAIAKMTEDQTMLGRAATLDDVANAAVFAASDWARTLTATKLNLTVGATVD